MNDPETCPKKVTLLGEAMHPKWGYFLKVQAISGLTGQNILGSLLPPRRGTFDFRLELDNNETKRSQIHYDGTTEPYQYNSRGDCNSCEPHMAPDNLCPTQMELGCRMPGIEFSLPLHKIYCRSSRHPRCSTSHDYNSEFHLLTFKKI